MKFHTMNSNFKRIDGMKKIALFGLIGFILTGCGEKKVTEEMLIGDWRCNFKEQVAKWKNGLFQDYAPPIDHETSLVTYLKVDNDLFVKTPNSFRKIKQYVNKMDGSFEYSIGDMKTVGLNKLEYISDDEFKSISEIIITQNKSEDNEKTKNIMHCTRIK